MADVFDDMMDTAGALPPDANLRPVPKQALQKTEQVREVPQENISLAAERARSEALLKQMGTSLDDEEKAAALEQRQAMVKKVYEDAEKNAPFLEKVAKGIDNLDNSVVTRVAKDTIGQTANVAAGITLGASKALWSGINSFKEGYNAIGKLAQEKGMIDKFDPAVPVDLSKFVDNNYPQTTKVVADLTQAISPAVAAAVTPGGPIPMLASAVASTYMLMDPKGSGLAELFKGTAVGKTLMLEDAFRYSEKKPDDTAIEGRLKNVLDYTYGEALIGGVIKGIYGMYRGAQKVVPFLKGGAEEVAPIAPKIVEETPVVPKSIEGATQVPKSIEGATQVQKQISVPGTQLELQAWSDGLYTKIDKQPTSVEEILKGSPEIYSKRPPQTIPGMIEEGTKRQQDPNWFRNLLEERKNNPTQPLSAEDSLALDLEAVDASQRAKVLTDKALQSGSEVDLLAASEALDHSIKVHSVKEAVASEAGRTLGITEGLERAAGKPGVEGAKEALEILGNNGRNKLLKDYIDSYGGTRPLAERLEMADMIRNIPDSKFVDDGVRASNNMNKVVRQTGFRKVTDAMYSVWTGAVLTAKTAANVYVLNQAQTAMEALDRYTATIIGKLPGGGNSSVTEANAFALGMFKAQRKAHALGIESLIEGKAPKGFTVNGDFGTVATDVDTAAANSVWGMLYQNGMKLATSINRLVMSADVVSKYVNEYAHLQWYATQEAMEMATRRGIPSAQRGAYIDSYVQSVLEKPSMDMMRRAKDQAEKLTQSRSIEHVPVIGDLQNAIDKDPTGLIRFVAPFFKTGVNVTANALERLPIMNLITSEARQALREGGKARDLMMAKVVNGSLFTLGVYELYDQGILHGEMPNYKQQQALADAGKGVTPYTLDLSKYGMGTYYIRGLDPLTKALRMSAVYGAVVQGNPDPDNADYLHAVGALAFSSITPEYMHQYNLLLDGIQDANKGNLDKLQKFVADVGVNLVPLRGTIKQISTVIKGFQEEDGRVAQSQLTPADDFHDYFKSLLKDTIGYGLPQKRDIFAQPIKQHWLTAINPWPALDTENTELGKQLRTLSDFEGKISRQGFEPSWKMEMPSPTISAAISPVYKDLGSVNVKMNADEYDEFLIRMNMPLVASDLDGSTSKGLVGKSLKQAVEYTLKEFMPAIKKMNDLDYRSQEEKVVVYKRAINQLDKVFRLYEDKARKEMLTNPDVQKKIGEAIKKAKPMDTSTFSIF